MVDVIKGLVLFKVDTGELVIPGDEEMLFITMTDKDLQMAEKYFDLLMSTRTTTLPSTETIEREFKRIRKYFYDRRRYIIKKHFETEYNSSEKEAIPYNDVSSYVTQQFEIPTV